MSFCGYKYRFGLYAAHSNLINSDEHTHYHNFTIILYIDTLSNQSDDNYRTEQVINDWLNQFQGQQLPQMELFHERETTVEGIGNTFFDPMFELIDQLGYELVRLEIYENPIRVFSVSKKLLDSIVNEINRIPLECIPILDLEGNLDIITVMDHDMEQEVAATLETKVNNALMESLQTTKDETKPLLAQHENPKKHNHVLIASKLLLGLCCFTLLAGITMYLVQLTGQYPQGSDTFCHLYRADLILEHITQGNWFPLYDSKWYNGVEIMRYWGPLPLYIIAGLEWLVHGSILDAYIVFLGFLIVLGGCGWLLWGYRYQRMGLSVVLGLLWFYLPENMRVVIYEGNLPRGVIHALLPFFFYFLFRVMEDKNRQSIWTLILVTMLITLSHLGITIMLLVTVALFVAIYAKMNGSRIFPWSALGASISGVLLTGVWVVPALIGGAASGASTNQVMKNFFESAALSLNPLLRFRGDTLTFYFGLSVFLICLLGILFGSKKTRPGFITAILVYLCTTKSIYELFYQLPFSQFLWMIRFIPIGITAALVSFFLWKQLKTWMVFLLCLLLAIDCATSIQYIYFPKEERIVSAQENLDQIAKDLLITEAKEMTYQRLAIMDLSRYGAFAPYYVAGVGKRVNYTFGAGWEGSSTASNIVNLNTAIENGWYVYLFDRALGLGNDTVLIPISNLKYNASDIEQAVAAAKRSGYQLVKNNGTSMLFHKDTNQQFGVITEYKNIAIGKSSSGIAMIFPSFEESEKVNINKYTFEELKDYETIYLSGFTYDDKSEAEDLLLRLAEHGVKIYIDMNAVPVIKTKKQMELFGVEAQRISFTEGLPELNYQGQTYKSLDFTYGTGEWNTYFLNGLEVVTGTSSVTKKTIPYMGTSKHENLNFIGLNVVYYLQTTKDLEIKTLLESIFELEENTLPNRTVVPIRVSIGSHEIQIHSEYDNVNTTIAGKDIYHSDKEYRIENNLVVVDAGFTRLELQYPHLTKGILVTVLGGVLSILINISLKKKESHTRKEENR